MPTRIRQATPADVDAIQRVARTSWTAAYDRILGEDGIEAGLDRWYDESTLEDTISTDIVLVAEIDCRVGGYAIATVDGETGLVDALYLEPDVQGRGVGTQLFDDLLDRLSYQGVNRLEGHVFSANDPALTFCRACGFEATETRTVPVSDDATAEMTVVERPIHGE